MRHAGAAFLGRWCPEALGDYVAGPNHVLPTGRTARFASGLSVFDLLKRTTWVEASEAGLAAIGPAAVALAEAEGLGAHAASVSARLPRRSRSSHRRPRRHASGRRLGALPRRPFLTRPARVLMFRSCGRPPASRAGFPHPSQRARIDEG